MVLGTDGRCSLAILLPFTDRGRPSRERDDQGAFTNMASALMAMEDFNNRDDTIIPQLADDEYSLENCNVYFPLPWDERTNSTEDARRFASLIKDDGGREDMTANAILSTLSHMHRPEMGDDTKTNHGLCAIAGSMMNLPARTASTLAAASDVPFFSHAADTTKISRPPIYPLSGKIGADEYVKGDAIISYLNSIGRDKVVLAYTNTNEDVLKVTNKAARDYGVELRYEALNPPMDGKGSNTPYDAMRRIKESGFKTIIMNVPRKPNWGHIAREAERWGINTDEYVWFTYDTSFDLDSLIEIKMQTDLEDEAMKKLLNGMGSVRVLDGFDWNKDDKFLASWKSRDADFVNKLNSMNPIKEGKEKLPPSEAKKQTRKWGRDLQGGGPPGGGGPPKGTPGFYKAAPDYFQKNLPKPYSSFMYDTVIAIGMGACRAQKKKDMQMTASHHEQVYQGSEAKPDEDEDILEPDEDEGIIEIESDGATRRALQQYISRPGKNLQYNETVKVRFDGASGHVSLDNGMIFTRDFDEIGFGTYNIRALDTPRGKENYEYALTSIRMPGGQWAATSEPFLYADGTSTQPQPVREVFENNYLSPEVRALGFALFSIGALICISMAAWTFMKRKSSIIKAAQPEFLWMICLGSFQSLLVIIMLSFDESYGTSVETLNRMCMASPWLFCTGYIMVYMALFSKLIRINSVLSFRRRKVKVIHVMKPAAAMVVMAFIVLTIWNIVDPFVWVREEVDDSTGETFGKCQSNHGIAFAIPLALLMIVSTLLACFMAHKTRDIASKFTEAQPMFIAIVTQLEVWLIGIPILIIVDQVSADAAYLGRVLIIFAFASTTVLCVIGSKFITSQGWCVNLSDTEAKRYAGGQGSHISGVRQQPANTAGARVRSVQFEERIANPSSGTKVSNLTSASDIAVASIQEQPISTKGETWKENV